MITCPTIIAWAASAWSPVTYEVKLDTDLYPLTTETQMEMCILDDTEIHLISVVAIDEFGFRSAAATNEGTLRELYAPGTAPTPTATPTGSPTSSPTSTPTGTPSATPTVNPYPRPAAAYCGDFNGDGVVGFPDFGFFIGTVYGKCNDPETREEVPCE